MSEQFDWQFGEDEDTGTSERVVRASSRIISPLLFMIVTAVIVSLLISSWAVGRRQLARSEENLLAEVQAVLDLQHDAYLRGDGDLFLSSFAPDSAFQAAQLLSFNQAAHRAGIEATRATAHAEFVWVNVSWMEESLPHQRLLFFERDSNQLVQASSDPVYWGRLLNRQNEWGRLKIYETDQNWASEIEIFVANKCRNQCKDLTVTIADDFEQTAVSDQIQIPSPRIIGLDEAGEPLPLFWKLLQQEIESRFMPVTIRFAIPARTANSSFQVVEFEQIAKKFMAANPNITIELITFTEMPRDLSSLTAEYDGIAVSPSVDLIAAGHVKDLTDFMVTDTSFDQTDFYEQIWQSARWQNRSWFMPQAATMPVLFYDKVAYRNAGMPEPSFRWTWDEMSKDVETLVAAQPLDSTLEWGFLDTTFNSLFSYAYNWNNSCTEANTVLCQAPLRPHNVSAALDWHIEMAPYSGNVPALRDDLSERLPEMAIDSSFVKWNTQSSQRQAAIWVDFPINFEHQFLLKPIGVVPFPGSERFDGITPLWVQGSFISQESDHPYAVWQWLEFLSYQKPTPRLVPARPSVARASQYWERLPRQLGEAMRIAFPFSRPVTLADQAYFSWEKVTAVTSGDIPPLQAAQNRPQVVWFDN